MSRNDTRAPLQNESERTATMTIDEVHKPAAGRTDKQMLPTALCRFLKSQIITTKPHEEGNTPDPPLPNRMQQ